MDMRRAFVLVVLAVFLSACGFVHDERLDGPYRLVAVDIDADMLICYDLGGDCIGRIPETVYAFGFNDKYLVAARHPNNDRSISEYYYLIRALDSKLADPSASVRGPFDAETFEAQSKRLGLPRLSRTL